MKKNLIGLLISLLLFLFSVPAMAEEAAPVVTYKFYSQLWFNTHYDVLDKVASGTGYKDTDLNFALDEGFSRFGAYFYYGKITANLEVRPMTSSYIRQFWGEYDFGAYKVLLGQGFTPTFKKICLLGRNENYSAWAGEMCTTRRQMIQITVPNLGLGTLKVAAVRPSPKRAIDTTGTWTYDTTRGASQSYTTDTDVVIPKIEASYGAAKDTWEYYFSGGYQKTSEVIKATDKSYDLDSYYLSAFGSKAFGPVTVKGSVFIGQNGQEYGIEDTIGLLPAVYNASTDSIQDTTGFGYHICASYKINDMYSLQGGYGFNSWKGKTTAALDVKDTNAMYYINMPIQLGKIFVVTPEICILDNKAKTTNHVETDQGKKYYFGASWLIKF